MDELRAYIDTDEYRKVNTAILKLSKLLLNKEFLSLDDVLLFNSLLEIINNTNVKCNRNLVRKVKNYQLLT